MYLMRVAPREFIEPLIRGVDGEVRGTFEKLLGRALTDEQWCQATLPLKKAGVGLRQAWEVADAAFVASRLLTRPACNEMGGEFDWEG